MQLIKKYK